MADAAAAFLLKHATTAETNETASVPTVSIGKLIEGDVRLALHTTHDFFAEFFPLLFLIIFIVISGFLLAWITTLFIGATMRQCRIPDNYVRLVQYGWWFLLIFLAVTAAFGAVGIDFGQIFIVYGLFGIAFSAGASSTIANAFAGIMLQTSRMFSDHHTIKLVNRGIQGEIIRMSLMYTEILEESAPSDSIKKTILIPNTYLTDGPIEVQWHTEREKHIIRQHSAEFSAFPTKASRFVTTGKSQHEIIEALVRKQKGGV